MTHKIVLTMSLLAIVASSATAQFSRTELKQTYQKAVEREVARTQANSELPWIKLVKSEERKAHPISYMGASMYGYKAPSFAQSAVAKNEENLFSTRTAAIQKAISNHAVLRNYRLYVPQPSDLTSLNRQEVNSLSTFFKQGTTYGKTNSAYVGTAKRMQDAVVEIRVKLVDSSHTAILLVDCRNKRVYVFTDTYKNRQQDRL